MALAAWYLASPSAILLGVLFILVSFCSAGAFSDQHPLRAAAIAGALFVVGVIALDYIRYSVVEFDPYKGSFASQLIVKPLLLVLMLCPMGSLLSVCFAAFYLKLDRMLTAKLTTAPNDGNKHEHTPGL